MSRLLTKTINSQLEGASGHTTRPECLLTVVHWISNEPAPARYYVVGARLWPKWPSGAKNCIPLGRHTILFRAPNKNIWGL